MIIRSHDKTTIFISSVVSAAIVLAFFALGVFSFYRGYLEHKEMLRQKNLASEAKLRKAQAFKLKTNLPNVDTAGWKKYKNTTYGFEINYPGDWASPEEQSLKGTEEGEKEGYDYMIVFKTSTTKPVIEYKGFEVIIKRNVPLKLSASSTSNLAENIASAPQESENVCSEKEISIIKDDFYFKKVFYYHLNTEKFSFDIYPFPQRPASTSALGELTNAQTVFPEFYAALSTFKSVSGEKLQPFSAQVIARPKVQPGKISCPGYGHPSMSKTKGKHMDEDCCPDPDEWPKPGCIYDAHGYGIMLSGPAKKKK